MIIRSRFKTASRVRKNFGWLNLLSLLFKKLRFKKNEKKFNIAIPKVGSINLEEIENGEFLAVLGHLLSLTPLEIEQATVSALRITKLNLKEREGFFDSAYDLGPGLISVIKFVIASTNPELIVETGVAAGRSSNEILASLHSNGNGRLVSVDISSNVGELIEEKYFNLWSLHVLRFFRRKHQIRMIFKNVQNASIFLHDSDHNPKWQLFEVESALHNFGGLKFLFIDDITVLVLNKISKGNNFRTYIINEPNKFSAVCIKER